MAGEHRTTDIGSETATTPSAASGPPPALDPIAVMRSRPYLVALVLAAVLGIPISVVAYGFLALVAEIQDYIFVDLPHQLLGSDVPAWWPVPWSDCRSAYWPDDPLPARKCWSLARFRVQDRRRPTAKQ